jgi:hypothetical protein
VFRSWERRCDAELGLLRHQVEADEAIRAAEQNVHDVAIVGDRHLGRLASNVNGCADGGCSRSDGCDRVSGHRSGSGANAGVKLAGEWLVQDVVEAYGEDGEVGERELLGCTSAGCGIGHRDGAPAHVGQLGRRNCSS